ncbi:hypothetical protein CU103_25725 [Phyllobacterium sophorae]|uniref:Uncharacterized protein n=1 Tax=Phyllobacterium sophorae TaxID=1520277 RepID=A0A2P7B3B3_9HYPH|nr:hypothetical protein CU103_25725 [Phyllobacterium sophorae]
MADGAKLRLLKALPNAAIRNLNEIIEWLQTVRSASSLSHATSSNLPKSRCGDVCLQSMIFY